MKSPGTFIGAPVVAGLLMIGSLSAARAATPWREYMGKPDEWFRGEEGRRLTGNILSWQSPTGSWPKNTDTISKAFTGEPAKIQGTFDNGATTGELRLLARADRARRDPGLEQAFRKGVDHILESQYPNGGWPQHYPPGTNYHRHITFNDDTMVRLMEFLREVSTRPEYSFVDAARRERAGESFKRGIQCILKCQILVNGQRTVWCAQHDENDYRPRAGRSYELESFSGAESASILQLLMSLESPSPEVVQAIEAGVRWFETARLNGIRQTVVEGDKKIIRDPSAPPLWARFYEIDGNRPFFCGRDGIKKYNLAEIEPERRNGYAWYGTWGERVASSYIIWHRTK